MKSRENGKDVAGNKQLSLASKEAHKISIDSLTEECKNRIIHALKKDIAADNGSEAAKAEAPSKLPKLELKNFYQSVAAKATKNEILLNRSKIVSKASQKVSRCPIQKVTNNGKHF